MRKGERTKKDCYTTAELTAYFKGKGGTFYALDASMPIELQAARLDELAKKGIIAQSPEPSLVVKVHRGARLIAWSTNHVHLSEAGTVMCFDALLQAMTGMAIEVLEPLTSNRSLQTNTCAYLVTCAHLVGAWCRISRVALRCPSRRTCK